MSFEKRVLKEYMNNVQITCLFGLGRKKRHEKTHNVKIIAGENVCAQFIR